MEMHEGKDQGREAPWYTSLWVLLVVILGIALVVAWATVQRGPARLSDEPRQVVVVPRPGAGGPWRQDRTGRIYRRQGVPPFRDMPGDGMRRTQTAPVSYI